MIAVTADTLSFTLPTEVEELTTAQVAHLLTHEVTGDEGLLCLLGGITPDALRHQRCADLPAKVEPYLRFLAHLPTPEEFAALPLPPTLTIAGKQVSPRNAFDSLTWGQVTTVNALLQNLQADGVPRTYLHAADFLNAVILYPTLTGQPFNDVADLDAIRPHLDALPCTIGLPLAAFFLTNWQQNRFSGRTSLRIVKAEPNGLRQLLRRALPRLRTIFSNVR